MWGVNYEIIELAAQNRETHISSCYGQKQLRQQQHTQTHCNSVTLGSLTDISVQIQ